MPHCESYVAVDLSQVAIDRLRELQATPGFNARIPGFESAELLSRRADTQDWMQPGTYDTVVLPSVVQYFPGIDYLLEVLDNIFKTALALGGSVFIGDVRSLPLLETFAASLQLHKASASETVAEVAQRVRRALAQEQELAIDPAFFCALKARFPTISHVEVLPKRGTHQNEMTRFRYDVLIRTRGQTVATQTLVWTDWRRAGLSVDQIRRCLSTEKPEVLALRGIANERVQEALAGADLVLHGDIGLNVEDVRKRVSAFPRRGIEPEDLWRIGRACGYRVDISFAGGRRDGSFDAVFRVRVEKELLALSWDDENIKKPWSAYANNPLQEKLGSRMMPALRNFLKERLPLYMVPSAITLLADLPLAPSGKVDREALPAPDLTGRVDSVSYVAPRTQDERLIAQIWSEVLGLQQVGIQSNFFDLGGHSLKATQVVSRIHRELGIQVALRELFSHPTVAELVQQLPSAKATAFVTIPKVPDAEDFPLSHGQRRLWILSKLEGGSAAYNMPMALSLEGRLDVDALQKAYSQLVDRHESLRTIFISVKGEPRQRVLPPGDAACPVRDLSGEPQPEEAARELALADAAASFDLEKSSVRASLLLLGGDRFVLLVNMHHIVSDDWSQKVWASEFVRSYAACTRGEDASLQALRLQYRDYASWQRHYLVGDVAAAHRKYWHAKLAGELPILGLPTDFPRPRTKTYRGQTQGIRLDTGQALRLAILGREHGASTFMVLVAVIKVLLHRYTEQDEIIVGFPISGRTHRDLEDQMGFYVNTLPLRDHVRREESFLELLASVKTTATEAYDHQDYPFDLLVDELHVPRDVSRLPMFDVAVIMQATTETATLDGVRVHALIRRYEITKFDLAFSFDERRDGELHVDITYNTDLFLPARVKQIGGHIRKLIGGILADPNLPISMLSMLEAAERAQVLALGAARATPRPDQANLARLFELQAARRDADLAVILPAEDGDLHAGAGIRQTMSYRELNLRANQLAHHLRRRGIAPDIIVGLCFPRSIDLFVAMLGVLKAGGAYLPLDTSHPPERWGFMLTDSRAALVITQRDFSEELARSGVPILYLRGGDFDAAAEDANDPPAIAGDHHLAYVIYTSGSTGRPKGVAVTHRNVVRLFTTSEALFSFSSTDVWTLFHSCAFDFSVWEIWGALLYGGRLVVVPYAVSRSPQSFYRLLVQERITILNQTPSAFRQLIEVEHRAGAGQSLSLRFVIFGGEALDFASLQAWFARHGDTTPQLVNMYGITETTVHVTYRPVSISDLNSRASLIGMPLPDMKLYLLDANREPVPVGVAGEIYVGGAGVAKGYVGRPELDAERFIRDPFDRDPQARLYRSGDLARYTADYDLEYLGRIDQQVQIRGFRVELGEIEAALGEYPLVRNAVVVVRGEGAHMRLFAYYEIEGEPPSKSALLSHLRSRLPDYMIPTSFLAVPEIPLTTNGKVDRAALLKLDLVPPVPDAFQAPETEMERLIASAFHDVGVAQIGLHDNYFDVGANSLLLVQVHGRLSEQLARPIPVISLFQHPTIAALAQEVAGMPSTAPPRALDDERERMTRRKAAREHQNSRHRARSIKPAKDAGE